MRKRHASQYANFGSLLTRECFAFVPQQDFTSSSDIDWYKSVSEIDKQLYMKYHLTNEEISFIESMIKPM